MFEQGSNPVTAATSPPSQSPTMHVSAASATAITTNATGSTSPITEVKKKPSRLRYDVWNHFTYTVNEDKEICDKCLYCEKMIRADPKKNGTTGLRNHLMTCKINRERVNTSTKRTELLVGEANEARKKEIIGKWTYDQEAIRQALAYFLVVDELPFKFAKGKGLKKFMQVVQPKFKVPSRFTVFRDIYQMYVSEKKKLKAILRGQRVCLTTDSWTSLQRINYMCLTVHFIDNDRRLHKKIINFCPLASQKGKDIREAIEKCLLEWGIDKLFTITVDNASSNDTAINYLRPKLDNCGTSIVARRYLLVRCVAYIINLIMQDGLRYENEAIKRIRAAMKYVSSSPSRLQKFKEYMAIEKIQSKSLLSLDVSTRWNSTYTMLESATKFEKVFNRFRENDPHFTLELAEDGADGTPTLYDWANVWRLVVFLEHFYELTLRVSGSTYVTSHTFFHEIVALYCLLDQWGQENDPKLKEMSERMRVKLAKYWGNVEKMNKLIYIATILNPRHKLMYVDFALTKMYPVDVVGTLREAVKEATYTLFFEYKRIYSPAEGTSQSQISSDFPSISSGSITTTESP